MNARDKTCAVCGRRARYAFATPGGPPDARCVRHAILYPAVFQRALRVALIVGTILFLINQADVVLSGHLTLGVALKVALTYLVPYSVSTYSALQINRLHTT